MLTFIRSRRRRGAALPASHSYYRQSHLAGLVLLGYGLLIVTGSLYPFAGWRWPAEPVWSFLTGSWPRYLMPWEIPLNIAGYIPFGTLVALRALNGGATGPASITGAVLGGAALSLLMETMQEFVPGRIASNLDVASNAGGALAGGVLAVVIDRVWDARMRLRRLRSALFVEGYFADLATALLLAWLFAQINPALGLLGTAGYADTAAPGASLFEYSAVRYLVMEGLLTAMNALCLLVLVRLLTRSTQGSLLGLALLTVASMILKSIGGAALLRLAAPWLWASPGAIAGLLLACAVFVGWSRNWAGSLKWLGFLAFAGVQILALLLPVNPYLAMMRQPIGAGHLFHLTGATWWAAQAWPWMVLLCIAGLPSPHAHRRFRDGR